MTTLRGLFTPFIAFSCLLHFASALWPMPRDLQTGTTLLKLSNDFDIQVCDIPQVPQDLHDAISRTLSHLQSDQLQRLIVGRGASDSAALADAPSLARLTVSLAPNSPPIKSIMEEATKEITKRSESYSLTIPDTDQGVANLTANSALGLLRGLTTFGQLWYVLKVSGIVYSHQAPVKITDSPAYVSPNMCTLAIYLYCFFSRIAGSCWIREGTCEFFLSINPMSNSILILYLQFSGRWHQTNFECNEHGQGLFGAIFLLSTFLLYNLRSRQMSQFHWHVVDAQSFPLTIPGFPELSQKGAYSAQEIYSSKDIDDIVKYAGAVRRLLSYENLRSNLKL